MSFLCWVNFLGPRRLYGQTGDGPTFSSPSIMVIIDILNLSLICSIWAPEKHPKKKKKKTKLSITIEFVNVHLI